MTSFIRLHFWVASCLLWGCTGVPSLAQPVLEDQPVLQAVSQARLRASKGFASGHGQSGLDFKENERQQLQQLEQLEQPQLQQQALAMQPQASPTQILAQSELPVQQMAQQLPQLLMKGAVPESLMAAVKTVESQIAKAQNAQELFQATLKQELEAKSRAALARKRVAAERARLASSRPRVAQLQFDIDNSRTMQRSLQRENDQLREELGRWRAAASNSVARDAKVVDLLSSHMAGGGEVHAASMFLKTAKPFLSLAPLQPKVPGGLYASKSGTSSELLVKQGNLR